ncbi:MAG: hypothetical protein R3Y29_06210, partial [bacterium]
MKHKIAITKRNVTLGLCSAMALSSLPVGVVYADSTTQDNTYIEENIEEISALAPTASISDDLKNIIIQSALIATEDSGDNYATHNTNGYQLKRDDNGGDWVSLNALINVPYTSWRADESIPIQYTHNGGSGTISGLADGTYQLRVGGDGTPSGNLVIGISAQAPSADVIVNDDGENTITITGAQENASDYQISNDNGDSWVSLTDVIENDGSAYNGWLADEAEIAYLYVEGDSTGTISGLADGIYQLRVGSTGVASEKLVVGGLEVNTPNAITGPINGFTASAVVSGGTNGKFLEGDGVIVTVAISGAEEVPNKTQELVLSGTGIEDLESAIPSTGDLVFTFNMPNESISDLKIEIVDTTDNGKSDDSYTITVDAQDGNPTTTLTTQAGGTLESLPENPT